MVVVAATVFCLMTASVLAADDLVVFDRSEIETVQKAADIRVFAKLDKLAAALTESRNFDRIRKVEKSARLVESSTDIDFLGYFNFYRKLFSPKYNSRRGSGTDG
jgi:hypothetical protein